MKTIISFIVLQCCFAVFAIAQSTDFASVEVLVTDFEQNPKQGETILFVNLADQSIISNSSNAQGKLTVELPYSSRFLIQIKGVGEDQDYTELEVPALRENETGLAFQIQIQFEPARSFTLDQVYFETGKSNLLPSSYPELKELYEFMQLKKGVKIEIGGHTDNTGSTDANLSLSQKRAAAVRSYLISKGIAGDRMIAKGYGDTQPIADNAIPEGRQKNRRTAITILKE